MIFKHNIFPLNKILSCLGPYSADWAWYDAADTIHVPGKQLFR